MQTRMKMFWQRYGLAIIVLFGLWNEAHAQAAERYAQAIATSREAVRAMMQSSKAPGVSVAVARNGEIVWNEAFGFADLKQKVRATTETRFGLGSVSKSFTGVLAARLMEEGLIDLDAPVEKYLPQFPHKNMSARLIIAHLSGLNDEYNSAHYYDTRSLTTAVALQEILATNTLQYPPRTSFAYTTSNYTIVAAIVEHTSGVDFPTVMAQYVFEPLELQHTSFNDPTSRPEQTAKFYVKNFFRVTEAPAYDPSFKLAGAGLLSTAADVARLGAALLRDGFLKPSTRAEIFRGLKTSAGEETNYALGWYIEKDDNSRRIYQHGGGGPGMAAHVRLYPQENSVIAILSNLTGAPVDGKVAEKVSAAFLDLSQ
ncbi:class A beta-lactamase-related serine hydrolase [candidate division KSB1 bacterium]|nr:MAG: class A beta-lactamase-related serine hydrolase [candidate division KSB1 bacterium]MBC6947777.1 class A beta-lactamase-related serine hydrolase [candidate division KSB1 bacterium]MCE7943503.1 class A beta-lactamase-related serine hydrolase [Chlorobi bacterium CHB1]MDL1878171.1 beta-lactamase family protein [Cytophagia bacterium CHB2]